MTSTSSGWLIAKATMRAKVSAPTAIRLTKSLVPSWMSFSLMCSSSSVLTAPGEITVVRIFPAPAFNLPLEFERTGERAGRRVRLQVDGAEGRHEAVAQVLVECSSMFEDDGATPLLKAPQQGKRSLGGEGFGELGEADDVREQDGHRPCRRLSKPGPAALGKGLGHIRRDIAREIRTHDLGLDLIQQGPPTAPDGQRQEQGEQGRRDKLGIPCRQADEGRLEGKAPGPRPTSVPLRRQRH